MDEDKDNPPDVSIEHSSDGGLIVRGENGRFLPGTRPVNVITAETSPAFHRQRRELKREAIVAAANEQVNSLAWTDIHGDLAFVAAIGKAMMSKATNHKDPKAVDAARFLLQEAGLSEGDSPDSDQATPANALAALIMRLLEAKNE